MTYTTASVKFMSPSGHTHNKTMVFENSGKSVIDVIEHELLNEKYNNVDTDFSIGDNVQIYVNGITTPWYRLTNFGLVKV